MQTRPSGDMTRTIQLHTGIANAVTADTKESRRAVQILHSAPEVTDRGPGTFDRTTWLLERVSWTRTHHKEDIFKGLLKGRKITLFPLIFGLKNKQLLFITNCMHMRAEPQHRHVSTQLRPSRPPPGRAPGPMQVCKEVKPSPSWGRKTVWVEGPKEHF